MNIQEKIKELKGEIEKYRKKYPKIDEEVTLKHVIIISENKERIAQLSTYEEISQKLANFEEKIDEFRGDLWVIKEKCIPLTEDDEEDYEYENSERLKEMHNKLQELFDSLQELKNIFREEVLGEK